MHFKLTARAVRLISRVSTILESTKEHNGTSTTALIFEEYDKPEDQMQWLAKMLFAKKIKPDADVYYVNLSRAIRREYYVCRANKFDYLAHKPPGANTVNKFSNGILKRVRRQQEAA